MGWLKRMIAWALAGDELAELERWRVESRQVRRWMAEFPDVCTAIDHLEAFASGRHYRGLSEVREGMRNRRAHSGPFIFVGPRDRTATPLGEAVTDWDVAVRS